MPLFGPIGGGLGLGLGASPPSGGAVVVAGVGEGGGGEASSAALTTSLEVLLVLEGKNTMLVLLLVLEVPAETLGVSKKPEAADAMLQQLAMSSRSDLFCVCNKGMVWQKNCGREIWISQNYLILRKWTKSFPPLGSCHLCTISLLLVHCL